MKGALVLLTAFAGAFGGGWAAAQHAGGRAAGPHLQAAAVRQAPRPSSSTQALRPSDAELETFVAVYAELQKTAQTFEREIAAAETAQEVSRVVLKRRRADETALRKHGWTREEFMRVAEALNDDPALAEKAVRLFGEDS
ncbi:MAG TPA: DUF4168 domain-containing protein [Gammaproteobacteria bacterium]|nr:DUF4168 domain-containing protein [Gammaproteobacteria bacterium]